MRRTHWGRAALIAILFSIEAFGQAVSGSITGAVFDPGAAVPNATVAVINPATGVRVSATTNDAGYYLLSNLMAGTYEVEVNAKGFRSVRQTNVDVSIGTVVRVDIHVELGSVQEAVNVDAVAPLVRTTRSTWEGRLSPMRWKRCLR